MQANVEKSLKISWCIDQFRKVEEKYAIDHVLKSLLFSIVHFITEFIAFSIAENARAFAYAQLEEVHEFKTNIYIFPLFKN